MEKEGSHSLNSTPMLSHAYCCTGQQHRAAGAATSGSPSLSFPARTSLLFSAYIVTLY